ncbi:hypothetical protein F1640_15015 [Novosphingobium sp. NBM11]|uniref:hypothetical protein n=1 Tax=Novosphingobium sp. NBM11 TaxID=2596914 RepID=UPI0018924A94|nr:hypothetical protein [Novosphingobium sp. NBM11]MBF5091297.1 hypothetical protein [Novosphingobium sp. NBM11]
MTRKRWFHAVSRMLERSNKEHAAAAKARSEEEERFNRRFPERELTESDARALMTPEEFNRWMARRVA